MPPPPSPPLRPLVVISGLSSTGKTTLTKHLSRVLCGSGSSTTIIHQDDFLYPEALLPPSPCGRFPDWDRVGALDWQALRDAVAAIRGGGSADAPRPRPVAVGEGEGGGRVAEGLIEGLRERVKGVGVGVVLLDGFLLFGDELGKSADVKILLRARQEVAKARRDGRVYGTDDAPWTDPEGYWDEVVWPAYVEAHSYLFINGDVEGELTDEAITALGIHSPNMDWTMEEILPWAVDIIVKGLGEGGTKRGDGGVDE